jgi:5'-nucleotidase
MNPMMLTLSRTLSLVLVLGLSTLSSALAEKRDLTIIHTNDFHGHINQEAEYAGAARIAAFVKQTRAKRQHVLVLDAGDAISGTPVSTMFQGEPIFEVMNLIGYDAAALGNHEFDHGYHRISKFREISRHPILGANAFSPSGQLIADAPALIKEINGMRIAIIGLITDYTPRMITPTGNEHISFAPPTSIMRAMVAAMRPGADLIIILSHLGHEEEQQLARDVDGIDLIVGGHSHTLVNPPVRINNTWIVQANYYGSHVGYLELEVDTDTDTISKFDGRLIAAADLPAPDSIVAKLVAVWEARVAEIVDVNIATAARSYSKDELRPILERILAQAAGTDVGFYNMGGIRDVIRKGDISARHVWNIEPFGNTQIRVTTDGSTLKTIFTMDFEAHPASEGFSETRQYTFATNSFVAAQAELRSPGKVKVEDLDVLVRDVLIDYIKLHGIK